VTVVSWVVSIEMAASHRWPGTTLYTLGHSTRTLEELVQLLRAFEISVVADIRTMPRSRHNPQFNADALRPRLRARRLRYVHLAQLGGLRHATPSSPNTAWRNASFRGYADYMRTEQFEAGLARLRALADGATVALMCAEAVPWRCHRSLVADALTARGATVKHITSATHAAPHRMTPFAEVQGSRVWYPGEDALATLAPFHLEATVRVLQRRPTNRVDVWEPGRYLRALQTVDGPALAEVTNHGSVDAPDVRFVVRRGDLSADARAAVGHSVRRLLGLDVDPRPLQERAEAQRALRPIALQLKGMRPPRFAELFEAFANVVPFQQVSLDAGVAIVGRLVERFGTSLEYGGRRFYAFPSAEGVAQARAAALKACGLSLRKAEALRQLARAVASRELDEQLLTRMGSEAALRFLAGLPGLGPWSAAVVLLRGLGRLDVFPAGDAGVVRGARSLLRRQGPRPLERALRRLGDVRGYLYFCLLGNSLLGRGLIRARP
jgi:3-methyladenine DNA glycosylase/8-oxoguanine DNA glycosylase